MCSQVRYSMSDGLHMVAGKVAQNSGEGIIVGLAGGSCSGKTYSCVRLGESLRGQGIRYTTVTLDDYFLDLDDPMLPIGPRGELLYDNPGAYHTNEIDKHLQALIGGKAVDGPCYDISSNTRSCSQTNRKEPNRVILVDGLFAIDQVQRLATSRILVFVDAPASVRLARRIRRDSGQFGISPEAVERHFWRIIEPAHQKFVEPQRSFADLVIYSA